MDPKSVALMAAVAVAGLGGLYLIRQSKDKDDPVSQCEDQGGVFFKVGDAVLGHTLSDQLKKTCQKEYPGQSAVQSGLVDEIAAKVKSGLDAVVAGNFGLAEAQLVAADKLLFPYIESFGATSIDKYEPQINSVYDSFILLRTQVEDMKVMAIVRDAITAGDKSTMVQTSYDDTYISDGMWRPIDEARAKAQLDSMNQIASAMYSKYQPRYAQWKQTGDVSVLGDWPTWLLTPEIKAAYVQADDREATDGISLVQQALQSGTFPNVPPGKYKNQGDVIAFATAKYASLAGQYNKWKTTGDFSLVKDWPAIYMTPDLKLAFAQNEQKENRAKLAPILKTAATTGSALEKLAALASQEQKDALYLRVLDAASPTQRLDMWNKLSLADRTRLQALISSGEVQGLSAALTKSSVY